MEFFDKKQDVIDLVVTTYGKFLLSEGRFDPQYYSFFDDDILYDSTFAGTENEIQNNIEGRIQDLTARTKQPTVYTGVESTVSSNVATIRAAISAAYGTYDPPFAVQDTLFTTIYNQEILQPTGDRFEFLSTPIGTSELSSDKYPAWNLSMTTGLMSSSADYLVTPKRGLTGSGGELAERYEQIPQINVTLPYNLYVGNINHSANGSLLTDNQDSIAYASDTFPLPENIPTLEVNGEIIPSQFTEISSPVFPNGVFLALKDGRIVISLLEANSPFKKENFEIQVFMSSSQVSSPDGSPKLLYYANGELDIFKVDEVEKYLSLRTDREIKDIRIASAPFADITALKTESDKQSISTKEFLIRDLYAPEEDICE